MGLMTPAWTDNSILTRWRHAHQSWVYMAPHNDRPNTSVVTRSRAACDFLCDTSIIVKKMSYRKHTINEERINIVTARLY